MNKPVHRPQSAFSRGATSFTDEMTQRFAEAEQAVAQLAGAFREHSLKEVQATITTLEAGGVFETHRASVADLMHNLKGQGASFGYDLVTEIATNLYARLRAEPIDLEQPAPDTVRHLKAIETVLSNDIKGDGGESARRLLDAL